MDPVAAAGAASRDSSDDEDEWFLRVGASGDAMSHLRTHVALFSESARESLLGCASDAYVSYDVEWSLSPTGIVRTLRMEPITPPPASAGAETGCVERALAEVRFPCSGIRRAETIHARICLRRLPQRPLR